MSASSELTVTPREVVGKASHKLASAGKIPAVLYGSGRDTLAIALDRHGFELWVAHHAATASVVELTIEGEKKPINAMIREVQHNPVKGEIVHVDFLAVSMNKPVHATVPLHLANDPEGVKAGGVLTVNVHELSVEAKPSDLPEEIEFDVTPLNVGDSLHVLDLIAPKGVTILDDPEAIVASVQAPRLEVEEVAPVEAAEPEVIGSKPQEEE